MQSESNENDKTAVSLAGVDRHMEDRETHKSRKLKIATTVNLLDIEVCRV